MLRQLLQQRPRRRRSKVVTAGEIADFARDYFESPDQILTAETDLVSVFGQTDPDKFNDFLETITKRYGIKSRELRDMAPGADTRPRGIFHFIWDVLFRKIDMEVIFVEDLTIAELSEIIQVGMWPDRLITAGSEARRRQSESAAT